MLIQTSSFLSSSHRVNRGEKKKSETKSNLQQDWEQLCPISRALREVTLGLGRWSTRPPVCVPWSPLSEPLWASVLVFITAHLLPSVTFVTLI